MGNKTYIAITIGPIYKTLYEAKRTRAVWAASYFFSWFMRSLLERCKRKGMKIYLPYSQSIYQSKYGSGLYADRLYFEKDDITTKEGLIAITEEVYNYVEDRSFQKITADFLRQYLNIRIIEREIGDGDLRNTYTLAVLNQILDSKELYQNAPFNIEKNQLQEYYVNYAGKNMFLAEDAFETANNQRRFRSISEIATTTLERTDTTGNYRKALVKDFNNEDIDLIEELKKQKFEVLPYHKYYAILYADGDNIGKLLEEIEHSKKDLKAFSKTLFEFGLYTEKLIAEYGGNGIYLGGEDILAFLPVACISQDKSTTQTLMYLIKAIDDQFEKTVIKFAKDNDLPEPTLSYGIMISYVKYPLKEAIQKAHKLLETAKEKIGKNSIGIRFQKHSGQYTYSFIEKSKRSSSNEIFSLMKKYTVNLSLQTNEVLSSIIHRFKDEMFFTLFHRSALKKRLDSFFENFFNEDIHQSGTIQNQFLKDVKTFAEKVINDYPKMDDCKNIIFTVLRLIHFINSKRD